MLDRSGNSGSAKKVAAISSSPTVDSSGRVWIVFQTSQLATSTNTSGSTLDRLDNYINPHRLKAFAAQTQDFIDAIAEGRPPAVTGQDGRAAIEMVEAADRSAATGETVHLPLRP